MCTRITRDKLVAVSENGKSFVLDNKNLDQVAVVSVDGCAITEGVRCDYLYGLEVAGEIFVELKGSDIRHAVNQISRSVSLLSEQNHSRRVGVIVASRVPKMDTSTQLAMAKVRGSVVRRLIVRSGPRLQMSVPDVFA